jgi:hypothetical protein
MPRLGFEPTIPAFELAKAFVSLDRTAIVIGILTPNLLADGFTVEAVNRRALTTAARVQF